MKHRFQKLIASVLTLAMILTMLPTAAFAATTEDPIIQPDAAEFKQMGLYSLRDNGRRVSFFSHATRYNDFLTSANMTYSDSWYKLIYVIEKSQPVVLELYEMKDEPEYMGTNSLHMPWLETDTATGAVDSRQGEEFLGDKLGIVVGVPVADNVAPLNEGDDLQTAPKVGYAPIDEDAWLKIVYATISGERTPEPINNYYAFGFAGEQLAGLNEDAGTETASMMSLAPKAAGSSAINEQAEAAAEEGSVADDITSTYALDADTEVLPASDMTTDVDGTGESELADTADEAPADEQAPAEDDTADSTANADESADTAADDQAAEESTDSASAEEGTASTENNDAAEQVDEEEAVVEEPAEEIEYLPEDSVLYTPTFSFFAAADGTETTVSDTTIQNIVLWDGRYQTADGTIKKINQGGRYVVVMQPLTPRTAIYNSFLGFDVPESSDSKDTFETVSTWADLVAIKDEIACSGDPVDLLTGSFTWNYTDFTLYGKHNLEFTRFYESVYADQDFGLGNGWTSNYSYSLEFDESNVIAHMPRGSLLYFPIDFDGSYGDCGEYTMERRASGYTMTDQSGTIYRFTSSGNIRSITNLDGNVLSFTYSGDKLQSVSNNSGSLFFDYSGDKISTVTDSAGRSINLSYDGDYLIAVENPDKDSLEYAYDANGYLATIQNFNGDIYVDNTYDDLGRVTHQYAANIGTFDFSYDFDARNNVCTGTDGYYHEIWFDEQGRIYKSADNSGVQLITYNRLNQITSKTDREGNTTSYEYDGDGNISRIIYADGTDEAFEYNRDRKITEQTDRNGNTSYYTYDPRGNMLSSTDARGNTTVYDYDSFGNMISRTDALGHTMTMTYDTSGNCTSITDALGNVSTYEYNEQGLLALATEPNGKTTSYQYSEAGKLLSVTNADGSVQTYEVNGNGFNTSESDWMGNVTRYTYDVQSNVTSITGPLGNTTQYTYDDRGNQITETDANGNTTIYAYDAAGRMISMTDAAGNTWIYDYNNENQLVTITDPAGGTISTRYDEVGRISSEKDAEGNTTSYTYDGVGNNTRIKDALSHSTVYEYDENNNLVSLKDRDGNETIYVYDENNRLISEVDAEGNTTSYSYNDKGEMTKVTSPMGAETETAYTENGQEASTTDALGFVTLYTYDTLVGV